MASEGDRDEARRLTPESATKIARKLVDDMKLKMQVLQCEIQFGGSKVIVYFSAPGRVDFRDLVKDLATGLKARVELKQVGARDEAKLVGGIGICGREFCCSSFLREFVPVSIKMAKNQNLALNPTKVSGGCGRLLCCLTYENDLYTELRKQLPPRGTRVRAIEEGILGNVLKGDVLNQVVLIEAQDGRYMSIKLKNLEIVEPGTGVPEEQDSEADNWAEDIDLAALEDKPQAKPGQPQQQQQRPPQGQQGQRPQGGGQQQQGQRPPQGNRPPKKN
jgi:cell fate regulator YaaT (PSP1 superfamily)